MGRGKECACVQPATGAEVLSWLGWRRVSLQVGRLECACCCGGVVGSNRPEERAGAIDSYAAGGEDGVARGSGCGTSNKKQSSCDNERESVDCGVDCREYLLMLSS